MIIVCISFKFADGDAVEIAVCTNISFTLSQAIRANEGFWIAYTRNARCIRRLNEQDRFIRLAWSRIFPRAHVKYIFSYLTLPYLYRYEPFNGCNRICYLHIEIHTIICLINIISSICDFIFLLHMQLIACHCLCLFSRILSGNKLLDRDQAHRH